ncbi:hypothetical protein INT43_006109 [Umbelopsis isabellina]|uniref:Uncharacterized protein n=1 Tax=Mortierella isabellina TaxID=91625 RepID=A0A8H7PJB7_MORIS|nr:hypothetical protein INT43_006109 [Umbelopsis isabellina]
MDDNSSYAESLEWHDSLHDNSAPYFPWQSYQRQDLFIPEFDEEEVHNITRSLVTPLPSKTEADDLLILPAHLRRNRQFTLADRCDGDDSSDLMAVELDYEQRELLREIDSPTETFRSPSPKRLSGKTSLPQSTRAHRQYPELRSKRYSIASPYDTNSSRDLLAPYDRQQSNPKGDFALPNVDYSRSATNKLHRASTISNPKYTENLLHKRSNSSMIPKTAYNHMQAPQMGFIDENNGSRVKDLDHFKLDPRRSDVELHSTQHNYNNSGSTNRSRSHSTYVAPTKFDADTERYVSRYPGPRARETYQKSMALPSEPKSPRVTFNFDKGTQEVGEARGENTIRSLKQPSTARRWSTLGHSHEFQPNKALQRNTRTTTIIKPTITDSTSSLDSVEVTKMKKYALRNNNAIYTERNEDETYQQISRRLRSASIGSDMSQISQSEKVQPATSKSAEVMAARRSKMTPSNVTYSSGRDRTTSLSYDSLSIERSEREREEKELQKQYLHSIKYDTNIKRLPQRSKVSRSLLPDFIGSSLADTNKEEDLATHSSDWALKWPEEIFHRGNEDDLRISSNARDQEVNLRQNYARISPSTTASSSSASNVSGDLSSRTATSRTRSTSTSIDSLNRYLSLPENKLIDGSIKHATNKMGSDGHGRQHRNQAPSPTFSMYSEKPWLTDKGGYYADEMYNQLGALDLTDAESVEAYSNSRARRGIPESYHQHQSIAQTMPMKRTNRFSSPASMMRSSHLRLRASGEDYETASARSLAPVQQVSQGSSAVTAPAKELLASIRQRRERALHQMSESKGDLRPKSLRTKLPTANWN